MMPLVAAHAIAGAQSSAIRSVLAHAKCPMCLYFACALVYPLSVAHAGVLGHAIDPAYAYAMKRQTSCSGVHAPGAFAAGRVPAGSSLTKNGSRERKCSTCLSLSLPRSTPTRSIALRNTDVLSGRPRPSDRRGTTTSPPRTGRTSAPYVASLHPSRHSTV